MKKVRLSEYRERRLAEDGLEVEFEGGSVVIPPADLWPEEVLALSGDDLIKALVGDQWEAFAADGGTAAMLNKMWAEREKLDLGEPQASPPS